MVALQIRDVPDELRNKLAAIAQERGQSLQNYLLDVVNDEVRRRDNVAELQRFSRHSYGTRLTRDDVLGTLGAERTERDTTMGLPGGTG
ncbi:hypothetical protein C8250_018310 [Streptomyces sp. So13.3]|uniref:hypothetical protein n=1 Tax=Streptomyces TaxID=1883 RepID=UPI001105BF01|nr:MULTISPECIES: hypothetical protein [Streptomyces]MCZ4100366.1 hypothetical protein [Streptomyces sp. H39-C1]QNA73609.1 hypothetical protein C8250_018310 [Streptomyces sp. So13.3]